MLARAPDGRVVFLRGAAPGDVVEVRVVERRRRYLRAVVERRISAGAGAAAPFCPLVDRCGGCPWQGIDPAVQRAELEAHVGRTLRRAAQGAPGPPPRIGALVHVPPDRAWRSTVRLHWAGGALGFRVPGGRAVVDAPACPVAAPEVAALLAEVRARLLPALRGEGTLRLTAAPGADSGTVALALDRPDRALAAALETFVAASPRCHGGEVRIRGRRPVAFGEPVNVLGPHRVPHPAASFVQAHQPGNAALVEAATAAATGPSAPGGGAVLELFAGSGNFTFALAAAGARVTAVESEPAAVDRLVREARRRGAGDRVRAIRGDAARPPAGPFDVLFLDPPRAGMPALPDVAAAAGARRIVYVSCDPATLARDVARLVARGWRLEEATPFDLFPHTGHVETLAVLERPPPGGDY